MSTSKKSKAAKTLMLCSLMLALTSGNTLPDGPTVLSSKSMHKRLPVVMPTVGAKTTPKAPSTTSTTTPKTPTTTPTSTPTTPTTPETPVRSTPNPVEPPAVPTDEEPDAPKKSELEIKFDYANSFLAGFRSRETLPSATNCT